MSSVPTISVTGNSFGNEKAVIEFHTGKTRPDGVDAVLSLEVLEFHFRVETFFYGFNLKTFVEQAEAVADGRSTVAKLLNYDETLALEFIHLSGGEEFVSIRYKSIAPDAPTDRTLDTLRRISTLIPAANTGSQFVLSFMKLDTSLAECSRRFSDTLANLKVATECPYIEKVL